VVTGAIYDRYQSCAPMMSAYIALSVIAGCLYTMLAQPKRLYNTENVFVCSVRLVPNRSGFTHTITATALIVR
jgi:hypothetical protein